MAAPPFEKLANKADPNWTLDLSGTLRFRWATPGDVPSLMYVGALAYGTHETEECQSDFALRRCEYQSTAGLTGGNASDWAVCLDTSQPLPSVPAWRAPAARPKATESELGRDVRARYGQAKERIIAVIYLEREYMHFDGQSDGIAFGRIAIVATCSAYRQRREIMEELYSRSQERGDAFCAVNGIPSYYRKHGYEYGMRDVFQRLSTRLDAALPLSDQSEGYTLRPCLPADADELLCLHIAQLPTSQLFVRQHGEDDKVAFLSGVRKSPFTDCERLDNPRSTPVALLEHHGKAIAAVVFISGQHPKPVLETLRICYDPEHADLGRLAREMVSRVVAASNAFWDAQQAGASAGFEEGAEVLMPKPQELIWRPPAGSALVPHLVAQKIAYPVDQDMLFATAQYQLFRLHSICSVLQGMRSAFSARMKAARFLLGRALTIDLGIACYQTSHRGSILRIVDNQAIEAIEHSFPPHAVRGNDISSSGPIQIIAPMSALVQLFFGFADIAKLKEIFPDMQVADGARVLVETLFPSRMYGGHLFT